MRPLHPGSFWLRLGPEAQRRKDSLPRRQELKETGGSGSSKEAGGATTQLVGERRGLRAAAKRSTLRRPGSLKQEAMPKQSEAKEEVEVMILGKALLESETHG